MIELAHRVKGCTVSLHCFAKATPGANRIRHAGDISQSCGDQIAGTANP
jgi:hypothetical protein